jgi:hypothetical protein
MSGSDNEHDAQDSLAGVPGTSTNALDTDVAAIADPHLRRRIAAALDRLRAAAEYGLVFVSRSGRTATPHCARPQARGTRSESKRSTAKWRDSCPSTSTSGRLVTRLPGLYDRWFP